MKFRETVDKILGGFLVFVMGVLVLDVVWQVISRYLMKEPGSFTDELAGFLLIWVGLLGAAYATGQKLHLSIDLLYRKVSLQKKHILIVIINMLIILFALFVFIIGGSRLVYITLKLNQLSSVLQLPLGYVYIILPISGVFIIYYALYEIINRKTIVKE